MLGALVHRLQETAYIVPEDTVAFTASQATSLAEDVVGHTARRAGLFLRLGQRFMRAHSPQHFRQGESGGVCYILFLGAACAQIHLVNFPLQYLREKHLGYFVLANVTLHDSGNFIATLGYGKRLCRLVAEAVTQRKPPWMRWRWLAAEKTVTGLHGPEPPIQISQFLLMSRSPIRASAQLFTDSRFRAPPLSHVRMLLPRKRIALQSSRLLRYGHAN